MNPAVLSVSDRSAALRDRLATLLGGEALRTESPAATLVALFGQGRPIVFIGASGIVIRALSKVVADKEAEPPVIAVAETGSAVVPLLGGHRGANDLARIIARELGVPPAITTASDNRFGVALDAPPKGWTLANPQDHRSVASALLDGASARLEGDLPWLANAGIPIRPNAKITLRASPRIEEARPDVLLYHPRCLAVGVGCERDCTTEELIALVDDSLGAAGLARESVGCLVSLDVKMDEPAVHAAADALGVPVRFFSAARLEQETPRLVHPSEVVFRAVGCHGVAEGAALAAVGPNGQLVVEKQRSRRATCAVAEAPAILDASTVGSRRGHLSIVGLGPGAAAWRTPEAEALILEADDLVGYGLYLDLAAGIGGRATSHRFDLGQEETRARTALDFAAAGRNVCLVSSGDPGIYAMAALVFELLDKDQDGRWSRIALTVSPGVSALQAAAARAGAPIGHDFCVVSLSDLLTPWAAIEARIEVAASGDFVVAFYNPVSKRRRTQLEAARSILLKHRPAETPVVLARSLGRPDETVNFTTLEAISVDDVDMLTIVLVGSSETRAVEHHGAWRWIYTPRGYAGKAGSQLGIDRRRSGP